MSALLAWTVRRYLCANLIEFLKKILTSPSFSEQFRQNSTNFTRNRKLPFISVFLYLCNFFKSSYQSELNKFFKILSGSAVATKVVCKVAFCKARKKLKYEAFTTLNNHAVNLNAPTTSIAACREHGLDTQPMSLRLSRVELDTGETEVLISSLTDSAQYPHSLFAELYHERWPVEEDYKVVKCRIEMENFSGQSVLSVYQDFHVRVFSKNITAMLTFATQQTMEKLSEPRKHCYKINFTQALSTMRDTIVLLFQKTSRAVHAIIEDLLTTFAQAVEPVRPGRKYPRNHKRSQRKYCLNYKPTL